MLKRAGSMPRMRSALDQRSSNGVSNTIRSSKSTGIHAPCAISLSSWPGTPARVAEHEQHALRPGPRRQPGEQVARCSDAEPLRHAHDVLVRARGVVLFEHDPAGVRRDRAADEHVRGIRSRARRQRQPEPLEHRVQLDLRRTVDHEAERAFGPVIDQQHDGAFEVRIEQRRRRDQEARCQLRRHNGHSLPLNRGRLANGEACPAPIRGEIGCNIAATQVALRTRCARNAYRARSRAQRSGSRTSTTYS